MEPAQIIPSQGLPKEGCFESLFYRGHSFLAYTTKTSVVIVSSFTRTRKLLNIPEENGPIVSLSWNNITGTLAVASENAIRVYIPLAILHPSGYIRTWQFVKEFTFPGSGITRIAWLDRLGQLLVCGKNIEIWEFSFELLRSRDSLTKKDIDDLSQEPMELIWKGELLAPVHYCCVSPDCRYFVTAGRHDRLLKIWYRYFDEILPDNENKDYENYVEPEYEMTYRFNYLPHPRAVTFVQFRRGRKTISKMQNILLTNCSDGLGRCWIESGHYTFTASAVINTGAGNILSWIQYHPFLDVAPEDEDIDIGLEKGLKETIQKNKKSKIKYEAEDQIEIMKNFRTIQSERFTVGRETPSISDFIIVIEGDHIVALHQISNINDSLVHNPIPVRNLLVPSLFMKTKVSKTHHFPNPAFLIPCCQEISAADIPTRIMIQLMNRKGSICFWDLLVSQDVGIVSNFRSCIRVQGHTEPLTSIRGNQNHSYISTQSDNSSETLLWKVNDLSLMEMPRLIRIEGKMEGTNEFLWLTNNYCITRYHSEGRLYSLQYVEKNILSSVINTFSFIGKSDVDAHPEEIFLLSQHDNTFNILGFGKQGLGLYVWELIIENEQEKIINFTCKQEYLLNDGQEILCCKLLNQKNQSIPIESEHGFNIVTGGKDGYVRLWRYYNEELTLSTAFEAHTSDIIDIHCISSFEIITLGNTVESKQSQKENALPYDIRKWQRYSNFPSFTLEQIIVLPVENIISSTTRVVTRRTNENNRQIESTEQNLSILFDILCLKTTQIMAVCINNTIYIYIQQIPQTLYDSALEWTRSPLQYTLSGICTAIHWTMDGGLIVASGSDFFLFSPWMDLLPIKQKPGTIIQQVAFETSCIPPFHPKVLSQYLLAGKFETVAKILQDLLKSFKELNTDKDENSDDIKTVFVNQLHQPKFSELVEVKDYSSISTTKSSFNSNNSSNNEPMQDTAASLFAPSSTVSQASSLFAPNPVFSAASSLFAPSSSSFMFSSNQVEETKEEEKEENTNEDENSKEDDENNDSKEKIIINFSKEDADELNEILSTIQIVGLNNRDQMFLIALINTFIQMETLKEGLDECGIRFLLFVKLSELLKKTTPRVLTLSAREFSWALHCEAVDTLIQESLPDDATWQTAQSLGIGYWLTNIPSLREVIKRIAKAEFNLHKSPEECAIFYIALGQKTTLMSLFKAVGNRKVADFLNNDFTIQRWKTAASKNAYALLGRQQYRYAAAFFLLAGSIKNAIGICVKHLKDYNLPLVFCRLMEGDIENAENLKFLLRTHILPHAENTDDIWLKSTANWLLKDYKESLLCIIPGIEDEEDDVPEPFGFSTISTLRSSTNSTVSTTSVDTVASIMTGDSFVHFDPAIVHLFRQLLQRPFIPTKPTKKEEILLIRKCVYRYIQLGCPILALEEMLYLNYIEDKLAEEEKEKQESSSNNNNNFFGFGAGMMIISEPDPEPEDDNENSNETSLNIFQEFLYPKYIEQALSSYLSRMRTPELIKPTVEYAKEIGLNVNEDILITMLENNCEEQWYFYEWFKLKLEVSSISESIQLLEKITAPLYNLIPFVKQRVFGNFILPSIQVTCVLNRCMELYKCLTDLINIQIPPEKEMNYIMMGMYIGIFFIAWNNSDPKTLLALLTMETITYPFPQTLLEAIEELQVSAVSYSKQQELVESTKTEMGEKQTGLEGQRYIVLFLRVLLARALHKKKIKNGCKINEEILKEMIDDLTFRVRSTPFFNVEADSSIAKSEISPKQTLTDFFKGIMKYTSFHKDKLSTNLFNQLFKFVGKGLIKKFPAKASKVIRETQFGPREYVPKFSDEITLYQDKDKDMIQAFCIDPIDPASVVISNLKEMKGITVNATGSSPFKKQTAIQKSAAIHNSRKDSKSNNAQSATTERRKKPSEKKTNSPSLKSQVLPNYNSIQASTLVSHPSEPYYLSGSPSGDLYLWLFRHDKALVKYRTGNSKITNLHFNSSGTKFGYCDGSGVVSLYRFLPDGPLNQSTYWQFNVHDKICSDFTYINSGTWIATAGHAKNKRNVCIWDVLLPPNRSLVKSFQCFEEGGATSIIYSSVHQMIIVGGKTGEIIIFNVKTLQKMREIKAHEANVQTLALNTRQDLLISGSTEGNIKIWSIPDFNCIEKWNEAHPQQRFVRPELLIAPGSAVFTKGVMKVQCVDEFIFSCGADGRFIERKILQ